MTGHVFILQGDLTRLACDGWLLPCDVRHHTMPHWHTHPIYGVDIGSLKDAIKELDSASGEPPRVTALSSSAPRAPQPWLTVTGRLGAKSEWYVEGVRQFVREAATAVHATDPATRRLPGRIRPLLGLPLVGTGAGGAGHHPGGILSRLLPALYDLALEYDVDLALVLRRPADYAAAVRERARMGSEGSGGRGPWPALMAPRLKEEAERLAVMAARGELVLFLGAGVSAGAGLPLWSRLMEALARDARVPGYSTVPAGARGSDASASRRAAFERLSLLDQATLVERLLATRGETVGDAMKRHLEAYHHPSLLHGLLACLPSAELVTTNYDRLMETALEGAKGPQAVRILPYEPEKDSDSWLLKLHGCLDHPEDIVLSRMDYLRYAKSRGALQGIVQALLVTRHLLFVGFSATDENFHQIVDDVRAAVGKPGSRGGQGDPARSFGTSLGFEPNPLFEDLWRDELDWLWLADPDLPGPLRFQQAAWLVEVFADYLSDLAASTQYLLDPRYAAWLSEPEERLRRGLSPLFGLLEDKEVLDLPAWAHIQEMLKRLGH